MSASLSSLANNLSDNLSDRPCSDKCKDCKFCLEYMSAKDNQLIFKCLKRNKKYYKKFNENLINKFTNTYEFCDEDINKFCC